MFDHLPKSSRVWVFQSARTFSDLEKSKVSLKLAAFLQGWKAHGKPLSASFEILYDRFIVVAVDDQIELPSGCSIDSMVHLIGQIEKDFDLSLLDRTKIAFKASDKIQILPLMDFKKEVKSGSISAETVLFNNSVNTLEAFLNDWEVSIKDSWAASLL